MTDRFEMNSVVKLRGEFRTPKTASPPNALIDPSVVTLTIRKPDKTTVTWTYGVANIERISLGLFSAALVLDQEGTYYWRWTGSIGADSVGVTSGVLDSIREPNF